VGTPPANSGIKPGRKPDSTITVPQFGAPAALGSLHRRMRRITGLRYLL
jgi:hypothetical protein